MRPSPPRIPNQTTKRRADTRSLRSRALAHGERWSIAAAYPTSRRRWFKRGVEMLEILEQFARAKRAQPVVRCRWVELANFNDEVMLLCHGKPPWVSDRLFAAIA